MKKDTTKTKVKFLVHPDSNEITMDNIMAYFPDYLAYSKGINDNIKMCYSHIGQHSSCSTEYANECREATPAEYNDLKDELESIGYNLTILNKEQMNEKNEILERFAAFFKASNQTTSEASQNMSDLQKMSIKRLTRLCINFNI